MDLTGVLVVLLLGLALGAALGASVAGSRARDRAAHQVAAARAAAATATAELAAARRLTDEADSMRETALRQYQGLSSEALASASRQFLTLAEQRLDRSRDAADGDLARREQAVAELVRPLTEALEQVRGHVVDLERQRTGQTAALSEQVRLVHETGEGLRRETAALVAALRRPQTRGAWGELHLRRSVEAAGMVERVDFVPQVSAATDDGRQRPDLVVRLAGGRQIVVDAKVPLEAFLDAAATADESDRTERLAAHARLVRRHVDDLAGKAYWKQFTPTPEFVVMFLPGESFLAAALDADPSLQEHAFDRKVVIATPATLVALLRTVAYAWSQEAVAADAQRVLDLGRQLVDRLETLGGHLDRLGRALNTSVAAFNDTVGSYDRRVLVTARRFADAASLDGDLGGPEPLTVVPRQVRLPEHEATPATPQAALRPI